jgi:hypothetical protein
MPNIHLPKTCLEYSNTCCWKKPVVASPSPSLVEKKAIIFVILAPIMTHLVVNKLSFCHLSILMEK